MARIPSSPLLALVALLAACSPGESATAPTAASAAASSPSNGAAAPRSPAAVAPLNGFVENRGQWPDDVLFFAQQHGVEATVTRAALVFRPVSRVAPRAERNAMAHPALGDAPVRPGLAGRGEMGANERSASTPDGPEPERAAPLVLWLPGDASERIVEGLDPYAVRHAFLTGANPVGDAQGFARVVTRGVLPGVDVVLRCDGGTFEYDLFLAPGASLDDVAIEVEGATRLEVRDADTLVLHTDAGEVTQRIGASWQGEERAPLACRFRVLEPHGDRLRFGFEAPERDDALALVVDPSLIWGTYVGGSQTEVLMDMAVDATGAVYLLARAWGPGGSPTTPGSFEETEPGGGSDGWVGKLSADGSTLEWGAFLGGAATDEPVALAVDADGTVVVTGYTWSLDFPTTPGSFQPVKAGPATRSDMFVTRIAADGQALVWSTFFGQSENDQAFALTLYPGGDVLVSGGAYAPGLPITPGAFDPVWDVYKGILYRLAPDGAGLVFSTYFPAGFLAMVVHGQERIYAAGNGGPNAITTRGAFQESLVENDTGSGYIARFAPNVSGIEWATFLGGSTNSEAPSSVAVDAAGAVYVQGDTHSADFPTTLGAFDQVHGGGNVGYVTKLLPEGTGLVWSTFLSSECCLGGSGLSDLVVDVAGNATVAGAANEGGWPTTPDALQPFFIGPFPQSDATLTRFDMVGESLVYSTYLGSPTGSDNGTRVGLASSGKLVVAFDTWGSGLPVTAGAYQTTWSGSSDDLAALAFDFPPLPWRILGGGHKGSKDVPNLAGVGSLASGTQFRLSLRGVSPSAPGFLVAGLSQLELPLLGGTLVPSPDVHAPIQVDSAGAFDVTIPWPTLPGGTELTAQAWFFDPGASHGWSASNAVMMIAQ